MLIQGITVYLYSETKTGTDAFNRPIYSAQAVPVENVLIEPLSESEVLDTLNLTGRRAVYRLCLPKGDTHDWTNKEVEFFGKRWRTIGDELEWIESMVPLEWNKKVKVERINGKS